MKKPKKYKKRRVLLLKKPRKNPINPDIYIYKKSIAYVGLK